MIELTYCDIKRGAQTVDVVQIAEVWRRVAGFVLYMERFKTAQSYASNIACRNVITQTIHMERLQGVVDHLVSLVCLTIVVIVYAVSRTNLEQGVDRKQYR